MNSAFLDDLIQHEKVKLRIIGRNPERPTNPIQKGTVTVQLETDAKLWMKCRDYVVAIRGTGQSGMNIRGKVYGYGISNTKSASWFNPDFCLGEVTIHLTDMVPLNSWFNIEIYENGTTIQEIESGEKRGFLFTSKISPIAAINEVLLWNIKVEQPKKTTGQEAIEALKLTSSAVAEPVKHVTSFLKTGLIVAGVGAVAYFAWPFIPELKKQFTKAAR